MDRRLFMAVLRNDKPTFFSLVLENKTLVEGRVAKSQDTVLHLASRYGHTELVSEIVKLCPNMVSSQNSNGDTPLHQACRSWNVHIVMLLLETNPWEACTLNSENQSALFLACRRGNPDVVKLLLNQPWLVDLEEDSVNLTSLRILRGHKDIVRTMLEACPNFAWKTDKVALLWQSASSMKQQWTSIIGTREDIRRLTCSIRQNQRGHKALNMLNQAVYNEGPFRGMSTVGRTTAFKVFEISNNIALLTSLCIVIVLLSIIPFRRKPLMRQLLITHKVMWVAVAFMATAYFAATWVIVPHGRGTKWVLDTQLAITIGMVGTLFVYLGVALAKHWLRKLKWRREKVNKVENIPVTESKITSQFRETAVMEKIQSQSIDGTEASTESSNSDVASSMSLGYHTY